MRIAELAREAGVCDMIKVEVIGDDDTLLPDPLETYKACEILLEKGYIVCPYISDDVVLAKRLESLGVHAVMPLASPIGTGRGITNPLNLRYIIEKCEVPVIVDLRYWFSQRLCRSDGTWCRCDFAQFSCISCARSSENG